VNPYMPIVLGPPLPDKVKLRRPRRNDHRSGSTGATSAGRAQGSATIITIHD